MKNTLAFAALTIAASCACANPVTLTFEGIAASGSATSYGSQIASTQGGYDVFLDHGHVLDSAYSPASYAFNNGTDWLLHDAPGVMRISKTGGGVFALSQFQYGQYYNSGSAGRVLMTGTLADNSTISETLDFTLAVATKLLSSSWSNLAKVEFVGVNGFFNQGYDNFVINAAAAVPEPGSLALAGLALGGLALTRRRRV